MNNTFGNVFKATPVTAFPQNNSLRQIIYKNIIRHKQKFLKLSKMQLKENALHKSQCLSCQQIITTTTFEST